MAKPKIILSEQDVERLETMLEKKTFFFYTEQEIRFELARRDEFVRARENVEKYPELQLAFH